MPTRTNEGAAHKIISTLSTADLQSPIHLHAPDTPSSTTSLTFSPSALTPPLASLDSISLNSPHQNSRAEPQDDYHVHLDSARPTMDSQSDSNASSSSASTPRPDVHTKKHDVSPPRSNTRLQQGYSRAFEASKRLQRVMGFQDPTPFSCPPEMPRGLEQRFRDGLEEIGADFEAPGQAVGIDAGKSKGEMDGGKMGLEVVEEETEEMEGVDDTALEGDTDVEVDRFGSSITLVDSQGSEESSHAPLFPSAQVEALDTAEGPQDSPSTECPPEQSSRALLTYLQQSPEAPHITIQAPSPPKKSNSKKRAPSVSQEPFGPALTRPRAEETIGIPTLPASAEALWKFHFPGNTHALLTILLTWTHAMQSFYNQLPSPHIFPFHAAFPYPVTPPIYQRLLSVAFYDTSTQPHREMRFLGPGDAADLAYGEVDTFRSEQGPSRPDAQSRADNAVDAMKRRLGLSTAINNTAMHHRAATGEGRWSYILIKGHRAPQDETPPHVMLAFHISIITHRATCPHTIFPDDHHVSPASPLTQTAFPTQHSSALRNLTYTHGRPTPMYHALRSASRTESQHTAADEQNVAAVGGAMTLSRTVLKVQHAGSIPLIEGYRVDVVKFREWMEAVGRGTGKLVLWKAEAEA